MDLRRALALALIVGLGAAVAPASAAAATSAAGSAPPPASTTASAAELRLTADQAIRIAREDANVRAARREHGELEPVTQAKPPATWQVGFRADGVEVVQVLVDDPTGAIRESWTGHQVAWQMARGYEGSFGHKLNAPYVWLPLCAIFLLGLLDWRRPLRAAHLDLVVLLGFGVSHVFFNRGEIGLSVPLVYPVLAYLIARMLWIGFRGARAGASLRPSAPLLWLAVATVFLIGFRVALNIADSGVIDVGYSGVVGADRVAHGEVLYGEEAFPDDNPFGDTYGPANYYAYVPFELALPWSGAWDELAAGHAAAIFFDLATIAALFFLGRRLRPGEAGRRLGWVLAFAWAAFPYTAYVLQSNANDSLVAALVAWSLVAFASPFARGVLLAAAALVKFAPLALVPLYAAGGCGIDPRRILRSRPARLGLASFGLAFLAAVLLLLAHPLVDPGLATFWERTAGSQLGRTSPFSVWGQADLEVLQTTLKGAALALAALVAFLPRRRSMAQVAALTAAVLIATQLVAEHWFYLYVVWFLPPLLLAISGGEEMTDLGVSSGHDPREAPAGQGT